MSWIGLALLYFTTVIPANYWILSITLLVTIITSILEYIIPSRGTKRFGGSSYGIWGTNIGLVAGLLSPIPFGFLIGAFTGALMESCYMILKSQTLGKLPQGLYWISSI
jgi:uncharacterized protein YqgC (DUF456 family)